MRERKGVRFIKGGFDDGLRVRYTRVRSTRAYAAIVPYFPALVQLFDYLVSSLTRV